MLRWRPSRTAAMNLDLRPLTVSEFLDRTFSIYRHRFLLVVGLMAPQAVLSLIVAMLMGWGQVVVAEAPGLPDRASHRPSSSPSASAPCSSPSCIGCSTCWAPPRSRPRCRISMGGWCPTSARRSPRRCGGSASLLWATFLMAVGSSVSWVPAALLPGAVLLGIAGASSALQPGNGHPCGRRPGRGRDSPSGSGGVRRVRRHGVHGAALRRGDPGGRARADRRPGGDPALHPVDARPPPPGLAAGDLRRRDRLRRGDGAADAVHASARFRHRGRDAAPGSGSTWPAPCTGAAGQTLTAPIFAIGAVVLYFEGRIRHEALDLQVMTEALLRGPGRPAPAPAYPPVPPPVPS